VQIIINNQLCPDSNLKKNFFVCLKFVHHKSGAEWREIKRQLFFQKKIFNANFAVDSKIQKFSCSVLDL